MHDKKNRRGRIHPYQEGFSFMQDEKH